MKSEAWNHVHEHIESILPKIEQSATAGIRYPYLSAAYGPPYVGFFYHWDHHHMAMRFAHAGRPEYLRYGIDNILHHQRPDGYASLILAPESGAIGMSGDRHAQPFVMQGAALYIAQTTDIQWARERWPALQRYLAYYETHYRSPYGLFRWPGAIVVSGFDNDVVTTFFQPGSVIPADLNAWIYREYLAAADVARRIGDDAVVDNYAKRAQCLRATINARLWQADEETYAAYDLCAGAPILRLRDPYIGDATGRYAFQSCSNLVPLYAGVAEREHGRAMLRRYVLSEEHFLSPFGIRSLSRASEFYNNAVWGNPPRFGDHRVLTTSNWQGPVWIPLCYFMAHALADYGFAAEAEDLADRTISVLARSLERIGSFTENYHGDTGEPLYSPMFASWNILADILHTELADKKSMVGGRNP